MSTTYHTPLPFGSAANTTIVNVPLGELDAAIDYLAGVIDALNLGYSPLDIQLREWALDMVDLLSGIAITYHHGGNMRVQATVTWPDGSTGHCDGAKYAATPTVLAAFTASHLNSGKIVVLAPGTVTPVVITPDWYVDSTAAVGGDGSLTAPFDTLSDLTLADGDVVALRSGSTWREELVIPHDNISVYRYGSGARPEIDCSSVVAAGTWTKTAGKTNVYEATVSPALASDETWVRLWEDGVSFVRASSVANCDATASSYYPSSDTTAPITLYVHASDDSDPASNTKVYETNLRKTAIQGVNKANLVVDGLKTKRSLWGLGSVVTGRTAAVRYCRFEDGTKHNCYVGEGTFMYFTTAAEAYYGAQSSTLFVCYENEAAGMGFTAENCSALMTVYNENVSGFYQHPGITSVKKLGAVVYRDIIATNCGIGAGNSGLEDSWTIDGATMTGVKYGLLLYGDAIISNASITLGQDGGNHVAFAIEATADMTLTMSDSTLDADGHTISSGSIYSFRDNTTVILDTVEFINSVSSQGVNLTGDDSIVTATGCFFNGNVIPYILTDVTLTSDYNYFLEAWYEFNVNTVAYASVALYQAGTGQDAHSTIGSPP